MLADAADLNPHASDQISKNRESGPWTRASSSATILSHLWYFYSILYNHIKCYGKPLGSAVESLGDLRTSVDAR